ncbi:Uncharacterised protein [Mycobacteroides abscessus subsp. abscessus]|nr:Uncharacterised protein [Mycobacteroides abscessus subsp. abscessus]
MPPHLGGDEVAVHGEGDRGARVVAAEFAQYRADLGVGGPAPAEFDRHARGGQAVLAQCVDGGGGDDAGAVAVGDLGAQRRTDRAGAIDPVHGGLGSGESSHVSKLGTGAITG